MSRKSRHPRRPELVREPSDAADSLETSDTITVRRLTGELRTTLDAILTAATILAQGFETLDSADAIAAGLRPQLVEFADDPDGDPEIALDDDLDELDDALTPVALTMRVLTRALIATALDSHPRSSGPYIVHSPSGGEAEVEARALDELAHALMPDTLPAAVRPSRVQREAALADASRLVHEVGLEQFDVSCHLATDRDGTQVLVASPISPESAHVALLESVFERAEAAAFTRDPLLAVERDASSWEFSRWSAAAPASAGPLAAMDFARRVREQEYSLADRMTMALDASVIGELTNDESFAELFPRQHRVAEALLASFVDVFECVAVHGDRATFRALSDGQTYEVHEHMSPAAYAAGWIATGRLLPFDGRLHLRSPGMVFVPPNAPRHAAALAEGLAALGETVTPALALEGVISTALLGVSVPRAVKPARSRADARELFSAIQDVLADAELARELSADDVTEDLRARGERRDARFLELRLDATVAGFLGALAEQAGIGSTREGATGARPTKKNAKKHKARRRR